MAVTSPQVCQQRSRTCHRLNQRKDHFSVSDVVAIFLDGCPNDACFTQPAFLDNSWFSNDGMILSGVLASRTGRDVRPLGNAGVPICLKYHSIAPGAAALHVVNALILDNIIMMFHLFIEVNTTLLPGWA
ncbi:hypothetical protein ASPCAL10242 [Aspergillus calidoustus]|uniref:Uncharacterized protein n=1 Tax=Aspergillus calidoustus TaxID=454130 RepID=A0A0U5G5W4_ASPCI|nr:hypothetical protein ASPCAL10242 [Aspergillus calidoustus]